MGIVKGIADTKNEKEAVFARSKKDVHDAVRAGKYATAADSNGAIGAWVDDNGDYRCEAYRNLRTIELKRFNSMGKVTDWYANWMKKIE